MSLLSWTVSYAINLIFWLWVVRYGGAEWLEGTFSSGFIISIFAPRWGADGIKLFGYGAILISTVFYAIGVFVPGMRLEAFI